MINTTMLIILVLVLLLSLFSLVTTTHINTRKQQKEIGILLMLGYEKERIYRIYIYESFVLIINSCAKGIACGYVIGVMITNQRELYSSTAVNIWFDIKFIIVIIVLALLSSLVTVSKCLASFM